jgi:hypothetical protein
MSHAMFDRLTRRTAFLTLGAAGLAGVKGVPATDAKNKHKNKHKKTKKVDVNSLCKKQRGQCITTLTPTCQGDAQCAAKAQTCCQALGICDPAGFLLCVLSP